MPSPVCVSKLDGKEQSFEKENSTTSAEVSGGLSSAADDTAADITAAADDTAADDGAAPVTANATAVGRAPPLPADSGRATVTLFSRGGRETSQGCLDAACCPRSRRDPSASRGVWPTRPSRVCVFARRATRLLTRNAVAMSSSL